MNVHERVEVGNKKNNDSLSSLLSCESLVPVKENTDEKIKKKNKGERKKKNTDRTQAKLNAPHVWYNVKIQPQ